jgi:hypothetical protein
MVMATRRELLRKIGVGVASTAALGAGTSAMIVHKATLEAFARPSKSAPWWLLQPLVQGDAIGLGWSLGSLGPVERGASVLELRHSTGQTARVHICTYEGKPKGLAHTELFDLVLMDGGQGNKPTEETVGRVLLSLAEKMSENELDEEADLTRVGRMLTHGERVDVYGSESLT